METGVNSDHTWLLCKTQESYTTDVPLMHQSPTILIVCYPLCRILYSLLYVTRHENLEILSASVLN